MVETNEESMMVKICKVDSNNCQEGKELPLAERAILDSLQVAISRPENEKFSDEVYERLSKFQMDTKECDINGLRAVINLGLFIHDVVEGNRNGVWRDDFDQNSARYAVNSAADHIMFNTLGNDIVEYFPLIFTPKIADEKLAEHADWLLERAASILLPNVDRSSGINELSALSPLEDVLGRQVDFKNMVGRPTVILHFETWCLYCKMLVPLLSNLISDKTNVVLVSDESSDRDEIKKIAETFPRMSVIQTSGGNLQGIRRGLKSGVPVFVIYDDWGRPLNLFHGGGSFAIPMVKSLLDILSEIGHEEPRIRTDEQNA